MDEETYTRCCHALAETVDCACTSEAWGREVTERWTEIHCTDCGYVVEPGDLMEAWEVDEAEEAEEVAA